MKTRSLLGVGIVLLLAGLPVGAQNSPKAEKSNSPPAAATTSAKSKSNADDLAAIHQASQEFVKAFNAGDAKAIAALWTIDGDYTDETGEVFSGREAIEKEYAKFFAGNKGKQIQIVIDSLRALSDTTAIEDGRVILQPAPARGAGGASYMAVHVKVGGKWLMSTVRDSRVISTAPPTGNDLDDLEWLIGTWHAEEFGSSTESVCRWVANKSFVQRDYVVKHPDDTTSSGVQLIGYNPRENTLQSWNFSSDGGFAVGVWTRRENGWSAELEGTTGKGIRTTAVNLLTRLDNNAYAWQSVSRRSGGVSLPDTDEVVLKRKVASR